jgi:flagellar biogenesis protein FliO
MPPASGLPHKLLTVFQTNHPAAPQPSFKGKLVLGIFGLLAIVAGLLVPKLWSDRVGVPEATTIQMAPKDTKDTKDAKAGDTKDAWEYTPPARPELPDLGAMVGRLVFGTLIVVVLCVATLWMARRWLRVGPSSVARSGQLQVVESICLSGRSILYLVKAGDQHVLAGVDAAGLKALLTLPESFAATLGQAQRQESPAAAEPELVAP